MKCVDTFCDGHKPAREEGRFESHRDRRHDTHTHNHRTTTVRRKLLRTRDFPHDGKARTKRKKGSKRATKTRHAHEQRPFESLCVLASVGSKDGGRLEGANRSSSPFAHTYVQVSTFSPTRFMPLLHVARPRAPPPRPKFPQRMGRNGGWAATGRMLLRGSSDRPNGRIPLANILYRLSACYSKCHHAQISHISSIQIHFVHPNPSWLVVKDTDNTHTPIPSPGAPPASRSQSSWQSRCRCCSSALRWRPGSPPPRSPRGSA